MLRVVKLGGSLCDSPWLPGWLEALVRVGGRVVLVPGGGPFADAVRAAQTRCRFSDAVAHRLGLLAMEQYGLMLCGMEPELVPASNPQTITHAIACGRTPVWLPSAMCVGAPDIPEDWTVTSDSLSAWLAHHIGAEGLALVKHGQAETREAWALAAAGRVDTAFPSFAARYAKPIRILSHSEPASLDAWLAHAMRSAPLTLASCMPASGAQAADRDDSPPHCRLP